MVISTYVSEPRVNNKWQRREPGEEKETPGSQAGETSRHREGSNVEAREASARPPLARENLMGVEATRKWKICSQDSLIRESARHREPTQHYSLHSTREKQSTHHDGDRAHHGPQGRGDACKIHEIRDGDLDVHVVGVVEAFLQAIQDNDEPLQNPATQHSS